MATGNREDLKGAHTRLHGRVVGPETADFVFGFRFDDRRSPCTRGTSL
jgi:hypothetical protein